MLLGLLAHSLYILITRPWPHQYVLPQTHIEQVLPILLHTLSHPIPRVQAHSARAVVNLCDGLSNEGGLNPPHLDSIVQTLVGVLQADATQEGVKAQIITSLATVANAAGEGFGRFYGELMPVLISVLDRGVGEPVVPKSDGEGSLGVEERRKRLMKAKVLECCGLMGASLRPRSAVVPPLNTQRTLMPVAARSRRRVRHIPRGRHSAGRAHGPHAKCVEPLLSKVDRFEHWI